MKHTRFANKKLAVLVEHFPNTFKPYIDDQLRSFARLDVPLRLFANGHWGDLDTADSELLDATRNTRYVPATIKGLLRHFPSLALATISSPSTVWSAARLAFSDPLLSGMNRAAHIARMLLLGKDGPTVALLHNLVVLRYFPWLATWWPTTKVALYYHGAELPGTPHITDAAKLLKRAHLIFTNTEYSAGAVIGRGADPDSVRVLPVGFDLRIFQHEDRAPRELGEPLRCIIVGRLSEEKGIAFALSAFSAARLRLPPGSTLTIVGDGPLRKILESQCAELDIAEFVRFRGAATRRAVVELLRQSHVLLLPSISMDGLAETQACVVQEAQLCGCLVIASDVGGVREGIAPDMQFLMTTPGEEEEISQALLNSAALARCDVERISRAARSFVTSRYDAERLACLLLDNVESALR